MRYKDITIYPGVDLQGDIEEVRAWCRREQIVFSHLFHGHVSQLIYLYKTNPEKLRELAESRSRLDSPVASE